MSDSSYCYAHWRDADLIHIGLDWELEDLPNDPIQVPLNEQPPSAEESEQAFFEQQMLEMEQKWTDQDLPVVTDQRDPTVSGP
ncbi:hypothetical protein B0O80DRAFT_493958 [Mortierella sp. GBAus27b]|nr:hypothetical protein B0O80DRAFT_493958 [Mortierella sp. GBAus27b]